MILAALQAISVGILPGLLHLELACLAHIQGTLRSPHPVLSTLNHSPASPLDGAL